MLFFLLITSSFALFKVPGCENNPDGKFDDGEFDFVPQVSTVSLIVGIVVMVGSIFSVFPQYIKIIRKKDSSGLSPFYLLIQFINQISAISNASFSNATYIHSCHYIGFSRCFPALISWVQIVLLALMYLPQIFFYLIYYPNRKDLLLFKIPLIGTPIVIIISILIIASVPILEVTDGECGNVTSVFSYGYGIISTICVIIQWSPQIFMTFRRKGAGALSVLMMSMAAPGITIMTCYMIFITKQPFSTWLSNAASSIQQMTLLFLLIYYEIIKKKIFKIGVEKDLNIQLDDVDKEITTAGDEEINSEHPSN